MRSHGLLCVCVFSRLQAVLRVSGGAGRPGGVGISAVFQLSDGGARPAAARPSQPG